MFTPGFFNDNICLLFSNLILVRTVRGGGVELGPHFETGL